MPPAAPIPPRQPGETVAAYRNRRDLARTGKTSYQLRKESGQRRGKSTADMRGHKTPPGVSEWQQRKQRSVEATGKTPTERRYEKIDTWLVDNNFTPDTTGMSWTALRRIQPRLRFINENSSPGGGLTPELLEDYAEQERTGQLARGWITDRVFKRYDAMVNFMEGSNQPGRFYWFNEGGEENGGTPSANWWYYH